MTRGQLAVVRSFMIAGVAILLLGIAVLVIDQSNGGEQVCSYGIQRACVTESPSLRGLWIAAFAVVLLIGTAVAWSTLTPRDAQSARPGGKKGHAGRGLAITIGVLFLFVMAAAAIDIFS